MIRSVSIPCIESQWYGKRTEAWLYTFHILLLIRLIVIGKESPSSSMSSMSPSSSSSLPSSLLTLSYSYFKFAK